MARLRLIRPEEVERSPDSARLIPLGEIEATLRAQLEAGENGPVDAVETALAQAALRGASDLHFEPWDDCLSLRFRIDGILHEVARLPKDYQARVVARIKILAKIVIYQRDVPQDGRIDPDAGACGKAMRVSTFPTVHGEKAVIRILDTRSGLLELDALGFQPDIVQALRETAARPQGVLLLTGPSSSGKTTTIYALLREIAKSRQPAPHVVTVEDPVECRLGNVSQTEVRPQVGFTFEAALRALLRQDPEVIMVGEIRDAETARTAIQAGLTGHLVISTIHSGTAAGVFTRLLDMGIEPFLVASAVTGVLAQRLLRVNCPECAQVYAPDAALVARFGLDAADVRFVRGTGCAASSRCAASGRCEACEGIGYRGRMAVTELLVMNEELAELVLARSRTSVLHEAALRARTPDDLRAPGIGGMRSLLEDALGRVRAGATSLDEVARVL